MNGVDTSGAENLSRHAGNASIPTGRTITLLQDIVSSIQASKFGWIFPGSLIIFT